MEGKEPEGIEWESVDTLGNYVSRFLPFSSPLFGQEFTRDAKYLDGVATHSSLLTQSKFSRNSASLMTNKVFLGEASFRHQYAPKTHAEVTKNLEDG